MKSEAIDNERLGDGINSIFGDVPLKVAMLGWTPVQFKGIGVSGRVVVIPHPIKERDWFRELGVEYSVGACWTDWNKRKTEDQLLSLFIETWHIVIRDGIKPEDMHAALMVIPEYRDSLSGEALFSWDK